MHPTYTQLPERLPLEKDDRTNKEIKHTYIFDESSAWVCRIQDTSEVFFIFKLKERCHTDPETAFIGIAQWLDGRAMTWGEDENRCRCWIRIDDEVARTGVKLLEEWGLINR